MQGAKVAAPIGTAAVEAPLQGTVVSIEVAEGDAVRADQLLLIMEAMKMEHEVRAPASGILQRVEVEVGDTIYEGHTLFLIEEGEALKQERQAQCQAIDLKVKLREVVNASYKAEVHDAIHRVEETSAALYKLAAELRKHL